MKFPIITLLTISSLLFIQPTQSTLPNQGLIEHVCKLTPHYHLCCLTLKSHALARKDGIAFAKITLGVIAAKTPAILATLRTVHEQCEEPEFKMALGGCISSYTKISLDILPKALGCADKGDSDGVKQHVLAIANLSTSCQKKCMAFAGSTLSALADTDSGSGSGSTKTGSSSAGSAKTGSSSTGSINAGSSSAGSAKTGSSSAGSSKTGSAAGSINTGSGSSSAGSSKTGSGSASGSINTGSGSASAGSAASAVKPAVKAAAKAVEESNVYVQNMCAITVSIVTKVSATKQTTLT